MSAGGAREETVGGLGIEESSGQTAEPLEKGNRRQQQDDEHPHWKSDARPRPEFRPTNAYVHRSGFYSIGVGWAGVVLSSIALSRAIGCLVVLVQAGSLHEAKTR